MTERTPGEEILVRSWNVYHGRSDPPDGVDHLEDAIRVASADRPQVLCLQEVPPWALALLPKCPAIDHVLVRGAEASPLSSWTPERRRRHGVLLSDHAPVELTILAAR